jgi:hypothetical protein
MPETVTKSSTAPPLDMRAAFVPNSWNEEKRTIEVTFATETPVLRSPWFDDPYYERLDVTAKAMRLERINSGRAPFLKDHNSYSVENVLGNVVRVWMEGKTAKAEIRLSEREEHQEIIADIRSGVLSNVSVGYRVYKYEEMPKASTDKLSTYRATDWEPFEISLVAIPADHNSMVRSDGLAANEIQILKLKREQIMSQETNPTTEPQTPPVNVEEIRKEAQEQERKRVKEIKEAVRNLGLDETQADKFIEEGTAVDEVRKVLITEFKRQDPLKDQKPHADTRTIADETDKKRGAIVEALTLRAQGKVADGANEYRGMNMLRIAQECIERAGGNTKGMTDAQIAQAALNLRNVGMHSTSDFPILLGETMDRTLRAEYEYETPTYQPFVTNRLAPNFRQITSAQFFGGNEIDLVTEGGKYEYGTFGESKEFYRVYKYGKMVAVTWEAIVNDDLSAFSRVPQSIALEIREKQADLVYAILLNPYVMKTDNQQLFHSTHGNLAPTGTALDEAALSAMRLAMRTQKGPSATPGKGKVISGNRPRFLLVGPELETQAQKILTAITASTTGDVNVFAGSMQLIVEHRLTDKRFYGIADPRRIPFIETATIAGEELAVSQRVGFDVDGIEFKFRSIFGCAALDWRGVYKNPGL